MDIGSIITLISLILLFPAIMFSLYIFVNPNNPLSSPILGPIYNAFVGNPSVNPLAAISSSIGAMLMTLPDSICIGSLILSVIFQSLPLFMIFITFIELVVGRIAIGTLASYISPSFSLTTDRSSKSQCSPGVHYNSFNSISAAIKQQFNIIFPSETIFILGGIGSYVMSSILQMKDVMTQLGPDWESRIYIIGAMLLLGFITFIIYQLQNECNSFGSLLLSSILAILAGTLISFQNRSLLGKESINLLGLPYLDDRIETGAPLYVCSSKE
jgi:hypothetical protein